MPQINSGKSPPWVAGEIVTAAELNQMIDAATVSPSIISDQSNISISNVDPADELLVLQQPSGLLKKTSLSNIFLSGNLSFVTQSITGNATGVLNIFNPAGRIHQSANTYIKLEASNGASNANNAIELISAGVSNGNIKIDAGYNNLILEGTSLTFDGKASFNSTSALKLPVGTTAQRPATPVAGDTRFNSTLATQETYNGSDWSSTAFKVAILTREEPSTAGYSYTYPLTPNVWVDTNFNTISQSIPFVVNATSFTGVAGSAGTATVTVPAGTYLIEGQASVQSGGGAGKIVIKAIDTSTSATIKKGFVGYCANFSHGISIVQGIVTFASQTSIKFQTMTDNANVSSNLGNNDGTSEQVFFAKITKLA